MIFNAIEVFNQRDDRKKMSKTIKRWMIFITITYWIYQLHLKSLENNCNYKSIIMWRIKCQQKWSTEIQQVSRHGTSDDPHLKFKQLFWYKSVKFFIMFRYYLKHEKIIEDCEVSLQYFDSFFLSGEFTRNLQKTSYSGFASNVLIKVLNFLVLFV